MQINELNRTKSEDAMKKWISSNGKVPDISEDDIAFREEIKSIHNRIKATYHNTSDYFTDVYMGLGIYDYLAKQKDFSMRAAASDDFWRYVSLKIAPDIVSERWGLDNADHYWRKGARIWFRQVWWYIHLSWQGDIKNTETVLISDNFSTDTILNLAERTGRNGTYIDVYRFIMYYYSNLDHQTINAFNEQVRKYDRNATLFRTIMKLNTAKTLVIEPSLYLGGANEFARKLFEEAGVNI